MEALSCLKFVSVLISLMPDEMKSLAAVQTYPAFAVNEHEAPAGESEYELETRLRFAVFAF